MMHGKMVAIERKMVISSVLSSTTTLILWFLIACCCTGPVITGPVSEQLKAIAKTTYDKVIPCIMDQWMMKQKNITWVFPDDAEEHHAHLIKKLGRFRTAKVHAYAGYDGPWIENIFIQNYMHKPLSFFNGLIPLFVQWIDTDIASKQDFADLNALLTEILRPNVLYMAVSQGDIGLGRCGGASHPQILAMACGGYGHIPLPLIKSEIPWVDQPSKFHQDLGFFGNARQASRPNMLTIIKETAEKRNLTFKSGHGPSWKKDMETTKFNVAPRGYGRSSFRFSEAIQMGRVPFFVWDDLPWIPYEGRLGLNEHLLYDSHIIVHKTLTFDLPDLFSFI